MAKKKSDGVNKSQEIRDYMTANPDAGPQAVSKAMAGKGIEVSAQFVSTIKSMDKKKTGGPKKRGRKPGSVKTKTTPNDKISAQTLFQAKKLADQLGGVHKAKIALDALARLVD